jgi:hypothetical protein
MRNSLARYVVGSFGFQRFHTKQRTRVYFCPQHWLLRRLGLYSLSSSSQAQRMRSSRERCLVHTQRALYGDQSSRGWSGKITYFFRSGFTRERRLHFLFPVPNCHTEFLAFLRSSPPFFPACSPPPGCFFARACAHAGGPVR